jgi:hypothetical protein
MAPLYALKVFLREGAYTSERRSLWEVFCHERYLIVRGIVTSLMLLLSSALAFNTTVAEGTEVFMTNPGGSVIWGYGIVQGGVLEFNMSGHVGEFLLIVMSTAGEVRAWPGRVADGKIEIALGGEHAGLEGLLTALSLRLSLEQAEPRQAVISLPQGEGGVNREEAGGEGDAEEGNGAPRHEAALNGEARLERMGAHEKADTAENEGD